MFMHFGPLLELFETSTSYTWGPGRETCYLLHAPTYAQLGLRNFYTKCFIHFINFLANWPLAFRYLVQCNSSVNLSGKKGTCMELDSWVETLIVQPTKRNTRGRSRVKTCQRIVGNLNLVDNIRKSFIGRNALKFDEHTTKRHSIPSPLPDQLKSASYCVKHMLLPTNKSESMPIVISSHGGQTKTVDKRLINVNKKGVDKMRSGYRKSYMTAFLN